LPNRDTLAVASLLFLVVDMTGGYFARSRFYACHRKAPCWYIFVWRVRVFSHFFPFFFPIIIIVLKRPRTAQGCDLNGAATVGEDVQFGDDTEMESMNLDVFADVRKMRLDGVVWSATAEE
jgi:hypothetical protein